MPEFLLYWRPDTVDAIPWLDSVLGGQRVDRGGTASSPVMLSGLSHRVVLPIYDSWREYQW